MAVRLKLKRSAVPGKVPTTGDLELGELALNINDGKLFTKKSTGGVDTIVDLSDGNRVRSVAGKTGDVILTPADVPGTHYYHGFVFPYEVSLSYNKTTREVTLTPTNTSFDIWVGGVKYTTTGIVVSTPHPNSTGSYYLYCSTAGTLEWSSTPWEMKTVSPICYVYYDTVPADGFALFELHTYKRNLEWHESQHFAIGTFVRSGLGVSGYTLNSDGNSAVSYQVSSGIIVDEDIEFSINTLVDGGPYTVVCRVGAENYTWSSTNTVPYLFGTNWIQYNQLLNGSWQMTEAGSSNRWVNYFLYAAPALDNEKRLFLIPGQNLHTSLSSAQAESNSGLNLSGMDLPELVCVWKFTYNTNNGFSATGRVRLVEVSRITNTKGALSVSLSTTVHNLLTGRDALDAHPASAISSVPSGSIIATDVQSAINELDVEKAAVSHNHTGVYQPIDSTYSLTRSLVLTTEWASTSINGAVIDTGTYAVQVYANDISNGGSNSNEYYSGIMSWYAGDTNGTETDEIVLHRAGASADGTIYLRTRRTESSDARDLILEIRSNIPTISSNNYVFKFRKLI